MIIEKKEWYICKICNESIDSITQEYSQLGKYKTDYFNSHLKDTHGIDIDEYFNISQKCPCGICDKNLKIKKNGANFSLKKYACGRNEGVVKWSEEAKTSRLGKNNPMYKKTPWNNGLNKHNSEYGANMSIIISNRPVSLETRKRQSDSAKLRDVHGHTGFKHSDEAKEKMRASTLNMIKMGRFPQTNTIPCKKFEAVLIDLNLTYEKEYILDKWSFDFYLTDYNILIEIDGDYFHSNPLLYPKGPVTKTQRINKYRDYKKNKFCEENNIQLIRFWENEIIGEKQCVRQRLLELKK